MNSIVLLHGALGAKEQLDPLAKILSERNYSVHTFNFSGHGGAAFSNGKFGIELFAQDIVDYLDQKSIPASNVFGYSMGGYAALWLAHKQAERVERIITLGTKFDWSIASAESEARKMNAEKIQLKVPAFAKLLEKRHAPNDWKELLNKTADMMMQLGNAPLLTQDVLSTIHHRTLVLLGDADDMADRRYSEDVVEFLPNAQFRLLEETGHPIEKVNQLMLADLIDEALKS